jgi:hypothetical protein
MKQYFTKFSILLLLIFTKTNAQNNSFIKTIGDSLVIESASKVIQTIDGGFAILGNAEYTEDSEMILVKCSNTGDVQWIKSYGLLGNDFSNGLEQTATGEYYISGSTYGDPNDTQYDNFIVLKLDVNGEVLWSRTYGGDNYDENTGILVLNNGGVVAYGQTSSAGSPDYALAIHFDGAGNTVWQKAFQRGTDFGAKFYSACKDNSDNIYFVGSTAKTFIPDIFVVKLNSAGTTQWAKTIADSLRLEYGYDIEYNGTDLMIGGLNTLNSSLGANFFALKMNPANGDTLFYKTYATTRTERCESITLNNEGNFILSGFVNMGQPNAATKNQGLIMKISPTGALLSTKLLGDTANFATPRAIGRIANSNGYIVVGETYTYNDNSANIYISKFDENGSAGCFESNYPVQVYGGMPTIKTGATAAFPADLSLLSVSAQNISAVQLTDVNEANLCVDGVITSIVKHTSNKIEIAPNPAQNILYVKGYNAAQPFTITEITGKVVAKNILENGSIDVSNLSNGIYILNLDNKNSTFIKQ